MIYGPASGYAADNLKIMSSHIVIVYFLISILIFTYNYSRPILP